MALRKSVCGFSSVTDRTKLLSDFLLLLGGEWRVVIPGFSPIGLFFQDAPQVWRLKVILECLDPRLYTAAYAEPFRGLRVYVPVIGRPIPPDKQFWFPDETREHLQGSSMRSDGECFPRIPMNQEQNHGVRALVIEGEFRRIKAAVYNGLKDLIPSTLWKHFSPDARWAYAIRVQPLNYELFQGLTPL